MCVCEAGGGNIHLQRERAGLGKGPRMLHPLTQDVDLLTLGTLDPMLKGLHPGPKDPPNPPLYSIVFIHKLKDYPALIQEMKR